MKVLCFILAFYTVALSVYPCQDNACSEHEVSIDQNVQVEDNHEEEAENICSPFCICSCCASTFQLTVATISLPSYFPHNTKFVIPYQEKQTLTSSHSIWQPPRIS